MRQTRRRFRRRRRSCCQGCAACWPRRPPRRCWARQPRARASRSAASQLRSKHRHTVLLRLLHRAVSALGPPYYVKYGRRKIHTRFSSHMAPFTVCMSRGCSCCLCSWRRWRRRRRRGAHGGGWWAWAASCASWMCRACPVHVPSGHAPALESSSAWRREHCPGSCKPLGIVTAWSWMLKRGGLRFFKGALLQNSQRPRALAGMDKTK